MKVFLATDHTGLELKEKLKVFLSEKGYEVEDCGAYEYDKDDDYPDFIAKAAEGVSKDPDNARGIIFGGSGQGEAMVANKFKGVRCSVFYTPAVPTSAADISGRESTDPFEMLKLTRDHNNANMLSMGFRFLKEDEVMKATEIFLTSPYTGAERHARRIEKISRLED
jgi:ribose 5-phosphate isomerase B